MPAVSAAQRAWAFTVKGEAWAREHHFDTSGHLPARSAKREAARKAIRRRKRKK